MAVLPKQCSVLAVSDVWGAGGAAKGGRN